MSENRYHVKVGNGSFIDCGPNEFTALGGYGNSDFGWLEWGCVIALVAIAVVCVLAMFGIIQ